jgi:carbon storage regulator
MLVLSRKLGEAVVIAGTIRVVIVGANGDRVRIGVTAPPSVRVDRQEVHARRAGRAAAARPARPTVDDELAGADADPAHDAVDIFR